MDPKDDVPEKVLAAARELFASVGYRATSMQRIAEAAGITKPGLYYHFLGKDDILRRLTEPLLDELEAVLAEAERQPDEDAVRWHAIEGYLDVHLRHRASLLMLVRDMSLLAEASVATRFRGAVALANDLVAGSARDLGARVRAAQAVAGLGDAVLIFADSDPKVLRRHILSGVRVLLTPTAADPPTAGPPEPLPELLSEAGAGVRGRPRGRRGGRPRLLDQEKVDTIRRLYAQRQLTVEEIAGTLGVSRATVYRSLGAKSET